MKWRSEFGFNICVSLVRTSHGSTGMCLSNLANVDISDGVQGGHGFVGLPKGAQRDAYD